MSSSCLCLSGAAEGLMMLAVGTVFGAGFAVGAVLPDRGWSLPLLLDKELDFRHRDGDSSVAVVRRNPGRDAGPVLGAIIAGLTFLGMVPGLLGLFVVLPVAGARDPGTSTAPPWCRRTEARPRTGRMKKPDPRGPAVVTSDPLRRIRDCLVSDIGEGPAAAGRGTAGGRGGGARRRWGGVPCMPDRVLARRWTAGLRRAGPSLRNGRRSRSRWSCG